MTDSSSMAAVKSSMDKYIKDNIETTSGVSVHYEGLPFDDTSQTEWVAARILDFDNTFLRQGSDSEYAEQCNLLLQFNIYSKKSRITVSHRTYEIRDIINGYFKIGKTVDLYQSGTTVIDKFKVRRILTDSSLPETNELLNYVYAVEADFTKITTNPV